MVRYRVFQKKKKYHDAKLNNSCSMKGIRLKIDLHVHKALLEEHTKYECKILRHFCFTATGR